MSSKKLPPAKVQAYADTNGVPPGAERPSAYTRTDVDPNDADRMQFISMCLQVTSVIAKDFEKIGLCEPQLYASLKALQMEYDREMRRLKKQGVEPAFGYIPGLEKLEKMHVKQLENRQ